MKKDDMFSAPDIRKLILALQEPLSHRLEAASGYVDLHCYPVLPGLCLVLNEVHAKSLPLPAADAWPADRFFIVNYCIDGRCEFRLGQDSYSYVDSGLSSLGTQMAQDTFYYPSAYYVGFEIYAFPDLLPAAARAQLDAFSIDFDLLMRRYPKAICSVTPEPLAALWRELYAVRRSCDLGHIRLTTLQALNYLCRHEALPEQRSVFLTQTQSALAKRACAMLTADLGRRIPVRSVSEALGVSETSLKTYFRAVYGMGISDYLREARMEHGAKLLAESRENIADIARACGYVNQGRFATLFRERYGQKPLDYRRSHRMQAGHAAAEALNKNAALG